MKIVIEGTPEEIANALRKLSAPEDIKPTFAPRHVPQIDPVVIPFIPYDPPQTVPYPYSPATDRLGPLWEALRIDPPNWLATRTLGVEISRSAEGFVTACAVH